MLQRSLLALAILAGTSVVLISSHARGEEAFNRQWSGTYSTQDWQRFYHYPFVFYPQNFWGNEYYRSSDSLYYRYPPEMRVPVYNTGWHNAYPEGSMWNRYECKRFPASLGKYHSGHHPQLDQF